MAKKPKTWEHLRAGVKDGTVKSREDGVTRSDAVRSLMSHYSNDALESLLAEWDAVARQKADLENEISDLNARTEAIERIAFVKMEAAGVENLTVGSGRFSRTTDVSVKAADVAAIRAWYAAHAPDLLTVHSSRLTSDVKAALKEGGDIPDGVEWSCWDRIERKNA